MRITPLPLGGVGVGLKRKDLWQIFEDFCLKKCRGAE